MLIYDQKVILIDTAEIGQLKSVVDNVATTRTGTVYTERISGKGYFYAYNATGGALTANSMYAAVPGYSASDVDYDVQIVAVEDMDLTPVRVVFPVAAIPTAYYGWVQYKGDKTNATGFTSEARTVAGQMVLVNGAGAFLSTAPLFGPDPSAFAIVRVANTAASTTANIRLIGDPTIPTT